MAKYRSKVDIIYEKLMGAIRNGTYHEGDRLVISQIARQNGVSDIPVREAIRRLESEGYAKLRANQGAVVCNLDEKSMLDLFHVKGVLESYAARLAVGKISPNRMEWLRQKNAEQRQAFEEGDIPQYAQLNRKFHLAIYKCADNDLLYSIICDLWDKWSVGRLSCYVSPRRFLESLQEHDDLLDLIEAGNAAAVEELMRQHKLRAVTEINANKRSDQIFSDPSSADEPWLSQNPGKLLDCMEASR
ncbi:MAG: GntR family transcriptional regulator [Provencibacterium sp.]|nr:GntR family transcriptional regulator [Provencibacterium sp.]